MSVISEDEIVQAAELENAPVGRVLSLQVLGSCMLPLFKSGDVLRIERCEPGVMAPGDVVVGKNGYGRFMAHLLVQTRPVRTATLRGADDPPPISLYGRVTGVNGSRIIGSSAIALRPGLLLYHRLVRELRDRPWARSVRRHLLEARDSRALAWLRRPVVQPIDVRALNFEDLADLLIFTSAHLPIPPEFVRRQLWGRWGKQGAAAGAFDARGKLCGFAFLDEFTQEGMNIDGWWIRSLFVAPRARRMGVARRLIRHLCGEAGRQTLSVVRVDISESNGHSISAFRSEGFVEASQIWTRRIEEEWARNNVHDRWVVLERSLP